MQVTETSAAGLKREFRVVVPATDLEARVNERLDDLKGRVQLRGFRPGKVPVAHLKRVYGRDARLWQRRWRLFFLATAGLFGHAGGEPWGVGHYRLKPLPPS